MTINGSKPAPDTGRRGNQSDNMVSTMTSNVSTIQSFASTALLSILVDGLTIIGVVRKRQSEIVGVVEQGLQLERSVKAHGCEDTEEDRLKKVSLETAQASLQARRVKSLLSLIVSVAGRAAFVLRVTKFHCNVY